MAKILVTGAAGGFGRLIVEALRERGHAVVGTMRDVDGRNRAAAQAMRDHDVTAVEMDVTREDSVERGVSLAMSKLGGLDVVVNNAGVGVLGYQESFTADDWKRLFDVNVFGVQRVNRAVLPSMREQRSGVLLHISSLLGRIAMPFYSPYVASKWALEALAEGYLVELSQLGIESAIVEPGGYPTAFMDNLLRPSDSARAKGYAALPLNPEGFLNGFEHAMAANPAQDPRLVADAVMRVIEAPAGQRPFRTVADKMGMGDAIQPYNEHFARVTEGLYKAFGIDFLLRLSRAG